MKEIRLHGRGGQGVVSAAQLLVESVVDEGKFAHFIPFFGVERKGSPVYGFLRIHERVIQLKTQVYEPHCVVVFDDSLISKVPVYSGLQAEGIVIINSLADIDSVCLPERCTRVGIVDATGIALTTIGMPIPNTAMLGAFAKATGWVEVTKLIEKVDVMFGAKNAEATEKAFAYTRIYHRQKGCWHDCP